MKTHPGPDPRFLLLITGFLLVISFCVAWPAWAAYQPPSSPDPTPTYPPLPILLQGALDPAVVSADVIGYSTGKRPIFAYTFGTGSIERLIVADIHGGYEANTKVLAQELIQYLLKNPERIPKDHTLYIIPSLNPDGAARVLGSEGRANNNFVDLNRNFPAFWQADWPRADCWDKATITAGPKPASEVETQIFMRFIQAHHIDAAISYHSAGPQIYAGGQPPDKASVSLAKALNKASGYGYPPTPTECLYTGQLIDWLVSQKIAAVDVELTDHTDTDFYINLAVLNAFLKWTP